MPGLPNDVLRLSPVVERLVLWAFALLAAVHMGALAAGIDGLAFWTKGLVAVSLAGWAWVRGGPWLVIGALLASAAGDVLLDLDGLFIPGMGAFAVAHVCYVTFFARATAGRRHRLIVVAYAVVWAALIVVLWPRLDAGLRGPVAVYSLLLTGTAITSAWYGSGFGRPGVRSRPWPALWSRTGIGGALFLISDTMIALDLADLTVPGSDLLVMGTYIAAQYLLASGVLQRHPQQA